MLAAVLQGMTRVRETQASQGDRWQAKIPWVSFMCLHRHAWPDFKSDSLEENQKILKITIVHQWLMGFCFCTVCTCWTHAGPQVPVSNKEVERCTEARANESIWGDDSVGIDIPCAPANFPFSTARFVLEGFLFQGATRQNRFEHLHFQIIGWRRERTRKSSELSLDQMTWEPSASLTTGVSESHDEYGLNKPWSCFLTRLFRLRYIRALKYGMFSKVLCWLNLLKIWLGCYFLGGAIWKKPFKVVLWQDITSKCS